MKKLQGTEKQIAWAEDIRENLLKGFKIIDSFKEAYADKEETSKFIQVINILEDKKKEIENTESAAQIINSRNLLAKVGLHVVGEGIKEHYGIDVDAIVTYAGRDDLDNIVRKMYSKTKRLELPIYFR